MQNNIAMSPQVIRSPDQDITGSTKQKDQNRIKVFDGIRVSIRLKNHRPRRSLSIRRTISSALAPTDRNCVESLYTHARPSEDNSYNATLDDYRAPQNPQISTISWKLLSNIVHKRPKPPMYSISFPACKSNPDKYLSHSEVATVWVPNSASTRCQTCLAAFGITRRRHHCRLCGGLVCNDCSLQRTIVSILEGNLSRPHSTPNESRIGSRTPQRICNTCGATLANMASQNDCRVKIIPIEAATKSSITRAMKHNQQYHGTRVRCDQDLTPYKKGAHRQRQQHHIRVHTENHSDRIKELEKVLGARSMSRGNTKTHQHIISSAWLDDWLQYVHYEPKEIDNVGETKRGHNRSTIVRRPGPISNYSLLNFSRGVLERKVDLQRSRGSECNGDYHVISREVWLVFLKLYGGGPSIHVKESDSAEPCGNSETIIVSNCSNSTSTALEVEPNSKWIITELSDVVSRGLTQTQLNNSRTNELSISNQHQVTTTSNFLAHKSLSKRQRHKPDLISKALIQADKPSEQQKVVHAKGRYFWRRSRDDITYPPSISQIPEDIVLYDPETDDNLTNEASIHDGKGIQNKCLSPTKPITAISAFALAAAEARRKSTLSLMRHSSSLMSQSNAMAA